MQCKIWSLENFHDLGATHSMQAAHKHQLSQKMSGATQETLLPVSISSTMLPTLFSLVCPGFFLFQRTWAQVGVSGKPSLSAWPSPVVPLGERVTLQCQSQLRFEMFRLFKEDRTHILDSQDIIFQHSVDMDPVTTAHAGTYRCQGFDPNPSRVFSEISDPLVIIVTGDYRKPSLVSLPAPPIKSGETVTVRCCSETMFEIFILVVYREEVDHIRMYLPGEPHAGGSQANISIAPVTTAHAGTYRCYGSLSRHSHVWSHPSDPLDMAITGSVIQDYTLGNSIRMGVAGLVLLTLLIISAEAWWSHPWAPQVKVKEMSAPTGEQTVWPEGAWKELHQLRRSRADVEQSHRRV